MADTLVVLDSYTYAHFPISGEQCDTFENSYCYHASRDNRLTFRQFKY